MNNITGTNNITGKWVMDPSKSKVTFSVSHLLVSKVEGSFGEFRGEANVQEDVTKSTVVGTVDVTTITTDNKERDAHIRSSELFDVENYPTITFKTDRWDRTEASDEILISGELTIKDVTRPVVFTGKFDALPGEEGQSVSTADLHLSTKIDRKDWNLQWDSALDKGGIVAGDEISIYIESRAVRLAPTVT